MKDNTIIYDISPEVSEDTAVFPGDTRFHSSLLMDLKKGDSITLSSIQSTAHIGAHVDAPNHYHSQGTGIGSQDLYRYFGSCQVLTVRLPERQRIGVKELEGRKISAPRVLFKTGSFPNPNRWNDDFNSLSPELIDELARQGVILVGIDTPSIDPANDQLLLSHAAIWRHKMANLEGIVLKDVPDGLFNLVALPLRLKNVDASPVRAILIAENMRKRTMSERDSPRLQCKVVHSDKTRGAAMQIGYAKGITENSTGARGIGMAVFEMPPGAVDSPVHTHDHETAAYVLTGRIGMFHGDALEKYDVAAPGDFLFVPADVPHLIVNVSEIEPARVLVARNDPKVEGTAIPVAELESARLRGKFKPL